MNINEIVGRLKAGGLDASSTNRNAAVYVTAQSERMAEPGWFGFRVICENEETESRARSILSRFYDIEINGNVWRLRSKNRVLMMAIKRGSQPAPSEKSQMYLQANEANSTISLVSTLETAPDLEYSTDGVTWQEWQHTTADGTHTFDTITLGAVGDKVYFRGDNPNGLGYTDGGEIWQATTFVLTGSVAAGGNVMSLLDKTMELTEVPDYGFMELFIDSDESGSLISVPDMSIVTAIGNHGCISMYSGCTSITSAAYMPVLTTIGDSGCDSMYYGCTSITSAADMPVLATIGDYGCCGMYSGCTSITSAAYMPVLTTIGDNGCDSMYSGCTSITSAADMPVLATIGDNGCRGMYSGCTFDMSDDGTTLNFAFPTPPVTAGETTYATVYNIAQWMGNTNGF